MKLTIPTEPLSVLTLHWIDSHTRAAVFWDDLEIVGATRIGGTVVKKDLAEDKFEGSYDKGLAPGWELTAVSGYIGMEKIPAEQEDWLPIDAIAFDSDGDDATKTSQGMAMLGDISFACASSH